MAKLRGRTEGGRLLAATGEDHATIAAAVGTGRTAVCQWISGSKRPRPEMRDALAKRYGVPPESWDQPAAKADSPAPRRTRAPAPKVVQPDAEPDSDAPDDTDATPSTREATEARLRAQLARYAETRKNPKLSTHQLMQLEGAETRTLRLLALLTGEAGDITETRILRLPAWRRIQETILTALDPYPEAMAAVAAALRGLE